MATSQPQQTNWEIHPLMSARMKISLSWIVSIKTDLRVVETFLLEPFLGPTSTDKGFFEPLKEAPLKHFTFKTVFSWLWVAAKTGLTSMLGLRKTSDTRQTGPRCVATTQPASFQKISWPKRVKTM